MAAIGTILTMAPTITQAAPTLASIAGTLAGMQAASYQSKVAQRNAEAQRLQLEAQASEARAVGQHKAAERRRRARILQSNMIARGATTGAGIDPGVTRLITLAEGEGEHAAITEQSLAETQGRNLDYAAEMKTMEAESARVGGRIGMMNALTSGVSSMFQQFNSRARYPSLAQTKLYYG